MKIKDTRGLSGNPMGLVFSCCFLYRIDPAASLVGLIPCYLDSPLRNVGQSEFVVSPLIFFSFFFSSLPLGKR